MSEIFSDFWPWNFKKLSKLPFPCAGEQFLFGRFFWNFWSVLDFLQKPLAWFSKFYLRVQSKNCGRNSFFCFSFQIFFGFWAKKFSDFWPKNFKMFSKLPSTCPEEQFAAFFSKSFEPFSIFCRNLYDGSQNSIYVSRANFAEEIVFLFSFSEIFSDFERNIFRLLAMKLQEVVKTTFPVCRRTIFDWKIFLKFLIRSGFSAETFGMVLKVLSTCPE